MNDLLHLIRPLIRSDHAQATQTFATVHSDRYFRYFFDKGNFVPFEQEAKDCRRYAKDFKETEQCPLQKTKANQQQFPQRQETPRM